MLFHASIPARDPARVAAVLAEMWQGSAYPFPAFPNAYIVLAGDDRGTAVEIQPAGQALCPGEREVASARIDDGERPSETHLAIGVPCSEADLHRIATREGWHSLTCSRGEGFFRVVEIWVENRFLIEALTPEMQAEYRTFMTRENWDAFLQGGMLAADAA